MLDYVPQPDPTTCQSAACGKVTNNPNVPRVRAELDRIAATKGTSAGDPAVMAEYLGNASKQGKIGKYFYDGNATLNDCIRYLGSGATVITHGYFTEYGHVITLNSHQADRNGYFVVDDPWGEFDFYGAFFCSEDGDDVRYSDIGIFAYCVKSKSMIEAVNIYSTEEIDRDLPGMWCHVIYEF